MKYLRLLVFLLSICFTINLLFASGSEFLKKEEKALPFDVKDIIEKVHHRQPDKAFKNREYRKRPKANLFKDPVRGNSRSRIPHPEFISSDSCEFLIDTSIKYIPDENGQFSPSVAFDGTNYFVVWGDFVLEAVVGARVSPTGDLIDTAGIIIAYAYGDWWNNGPSVSFGDSNYLVVWSGYDPDGIMGVRVNTEGIVLDSTPIPVSAAYPNSSDPAVAYGDTNFLVVWTYDPSAVIFGARMNNSGIVLDPTPIPICTTFYYGFLPALTFGDSNFLVVWNDWGNVMGSRVSTDGAVLDTPGITISPATIDYYYKPTVSFSGSEYFVAWTDDRSGNLDIFGTRVNADGIVLTPGGIPVSTAAGSQYCPAISFGGGNYFVSWSDSRSGDDDIYGTRIDQAGSVLDTTGIVISSAIGFQTYPTIAFGQAEYFTFWNDEYSNGNIIGARIDLNGTLLDSNGIITSMQCNSQKKPKTAFDGTNYLVVWVDDRNESDDIYGSRVSPDGVILDPGGIPISTADFTQTPCQVVYAANQYLVIWIDYRNGYSDIYGARINTDGIVLDTAGIPISTANDDQDIPQVVYGGDNYFVIWQDYRNFYPDIYGARITLAGEVLEPDGIPISTAIYEQYNPQVTFDGSNYFVVWADGRNNYTDIYGTRITRDGVVLEPEGIPISVATYHQFYPQVIFGGGDYFVVWQDTRNGDYDIYGARVTLAGVVLEPEGIPIATAVDEQRYPQLTFGTSNYFVVWEDRRNNISFEIYGARITLAGVVLEPDGIPISTGTAVNRTSLQLILSDDDYFILWQSYTDSIDDIYGAIVNQAGVVIDTFAVSTQPGVQYNSALTGGNDNQVLIAYEGWTEQYQGMTYNNYRIWGKFYPAVPGVAEKNSELTMPGAKLFNVYPNPAKSYLSVRWTSTRFGQTADRQTIKIFDVSGKLVKEVDKVTSGQSHKQEVMISLKGINPGIYFLQIGKETKKFLIVK